MASQDLPSFSALIFSVASAGVAIFQVALALGAPWGEFTLGGRWRGKLPSQVRALPLLSVILLAVFASVVLQRAGIDPRIPWRYPNWLTWVVVAYCMLGSVANAITPSRRERMLWLPVVGVMLVTSLVVATS